MMNALKIIPLSFSLALVLATPCVGVGRDLPVIGGQKPRPQPKSIVSKTEVVVEWQDTLGDCAASRICVHGGLLNSGDKPATQIRLRVEIGGGAHTRPRVVKAFRIDQTNMEPGDRQEFYFELDRKTPYKNKKGERKIIEVGKFNFKVIPVWSGKKL